MGFFFNRRHEDGWFSAVNNQLILVVVDALKRNVGAFFLENYRVGD